MLPHEPPGALEELGFGGEGKEGSSSGNVLQVEVQV